MWGSGGWGSVGSGWGVGGVGVGWGGGGVGGRGRGRRTTLFLHGLLVARGGQDSNQRVRLKIGRDPARRDREPRRLLQAHLFDPEGRGSVRAELVRARQQLVVAIDRHQVRRRRRRRRTETRRDRCPSRPRLTDLAAQCLRGRAGPLRSQDPRVRPPAVPGSAFLSDLRGTRSTMAGDNEERP